MNFTNKKFTDLTTGRVVEVIDQFEDVAVLSDKSRIKVNRLSDRNYFDEYIDPKSFLKNESLFANFADKIHRSLDSIPDDSITRISVSRDDVNEEEEYYPQQQQQYPQQQRPIDLNNIPGSTSVRPVFNESAVMMSDPEVERMELMRKYGVNKDSVPSSINENRQIALNAQMEKMRINGLLDDEDMRMLPNVQVVDDPQRVEKERQIENTLFEGVKMEDAPFIPKKVANALRERIPEQWPESNPVPMQHRPEIIERPVVENRRVDVVEDPIIKMFQNVKRNTKFSIEFSIDEKIPRLDFIEMMEDSYNQSIIDFLSDEFTNKLINNPSMIKEMIKEKIYKMVYSEDIKSVKKPMDVPLVETDSPGRVLPVVLIEDTEEMNEGVQKKAKKIRSKKLEVKND